MVASPTKPTAMELAIKYERRNGYHKQRIPHTEGLVGSSGISKYWRAEKERGFRTKILSDLRSQKVKFLTDVHRGSRHRDGFVLPPTLSLSDLRASKKNEVVNLDGLGGLDDSDDLSGLDHLVSMEGLRTLSDEMNGLDKVDSSDALDGDIDNLWWQAADYGICIFLFTGRLPASVR